MTSFKSNIIDLEYNFYYHSNSWLTDDHYIYLSKYFLEMEQMYRMITNEYWLFLNGVSSNEIN